MVGCLSFGRIVGGNMRTLTTGGKGKEILNRKEKCKWVWRKAARHMLDTVVHVVRHSSMAVSIFVGAKHSAMLCDLASAAKGR